MGHSIADQQFSAYVRTSLTPDYRPLLTFLAAASKATNQTLASDVLIQAILDEADNKAAEKNIDDTQENVAMLAERKWKKGGIQGQWEINQTRSVEIAGRKAILMTTALHPEVERNRKLQNGGRVDLVAERARKRRQKARWHMLQRGKSQMMKKTMLF